MIKIKKGAADSKVQIAKLEEKIDANQTIFDNYIKSNNEAVTTIRSKVAKINRLKTSVNTVKTLEHRLSQMSDGLETLGKTTRGLLIS